MSKSRSDVRSTRGFMWPASFCVCIFCGGKLALVRSGGKRWEARMGEAATPRMTASGMVGKGGGHTVHEYHHHGPRRPILILQA